MRTSRASAFLRGVTIAAVALLLAGCGTDPFAPVPLNSGPPVLVVGDDGTVTYRQASSLEPEDDDDQGDERSLTVEKEIDGVKGGWLECGRFLLAIPSGAFDSTGTVTMSMPDSTAMVVELEIAPKRLNQFRVPVLLSLKTTGADVQPDSLAIYWYDPLDRGWVGMATERDLSSTKDCLLNLSSGSGSGPVDSNDSGVATHLTHFSRYSAGKAGW